MPLLSLRALRTLLVEWGPVYFAAWPLLWADPRRRLGPLLFLAGLLPACLLTMGARWGAPDLDRFLFAGTAFGFFLCAVWAERLESAVERGALRRSAAGGLLLLLGLVVLAGPVGCLSFRTSKLSAALRALPSGLMAPRDPLRTGLAAVGPRDLVLADKRVAQRLVEAGFVVAAPMASNTVGRVDLEAFDAYTAGLKVRPDWLFVPRSAPRAPGGRVEAEVGDFVLIKP